MKRRLNETHEPISQATFNKMLKWDGERFKVAGSDGNVIHDIKLNIYFYVRTEKKNEKI